MTKKKENIRIESRKAKTMINEKTDYETEKCFFFVCSRSDIAYLKRESEYIIFGFFEMT